MPESLKEKVDIFNEKILPIIEGLCGIDISLTYNLRVGDNYEKITNIMVLGQDDKIELAHKNGETWLIDFWAIWCPPC